MDYFHLAATRGQLSGMSNLGLAHLGDAVYELLVRSWLCLHGKATAQRLHREAVRYVSAAAQAEAAGRVVPLLNEEEGAVFRRGRNAMARAVPKAVSREVYRTATALEAVFGYLYLKGERDRINHLFAVIMDGEE